MIVLRPGEPDYPEALAHLPQPPAGLFARGRVELLKRPGIAVVGSRRHTAYGRDATVSLVVGLVRAGYVVISGLARGIDGIAHETALDVGADTVAVLGCGLDVPYPPEHAALAERIAVHGCLVTEFPPGTPPLKYHFPQRNRIISGLARAVLVVEATERSGALITANYALEEGKEVFAVPGPIHSASSRGTNRLIQDGAGVATSAADLLGVLDAGTHPPADPHGAASPASDAAGASPAAGASRLALRIWETLDSGERDLEDLTSDLAAAPDAVAAALLELELAGLVLRAPGPRFSRVRAPG